MSTNIGGNKTKANDTAGQQSIVDSLRQGSFMSRSGSGELLNQFTRLFRDLVEAEPNSAMTRFKVVPIEATAAGVSMSALTINVEEAGRVFSYVLLLEGTTPGLGVRSVKGSLGGNYSEVNIPHVPGDLYKDSYWQRAAQIISKQMGVAVEKIADCGASVVYSELLPTGQNNEPQERVRPLLWAAVNAIMSSIQMTNENRVDFTANDLQGFKVSSKLSFMNSARLDESGLPIRSGYEVVTYATSSTNDDVALNGAQPLTLTTGYVDLIQLTPEAARDAYFKQHGLNPMAGFGMMPGAQQAPIPKHAARIVCTYAQTETDIMSLNSLLAALAMNAIPMLKGAWRHSFAPRYNDQFHSLAGLTYELGMEVNPNDTAFSLSQFLAMHVLETPVFTLHIPEVGPTAHLWAILRTACSSNASAAKAKEMVLAACDQLTGGKFFAHFDRSQAIGFVEENIIPLGYYRDADQNARDLRDIDHLAAGNLTGSAVKVCDWADANNFESQTPTVKRLADKLALINEMMEGKYRLKGWAHPLTFNPMFIIGLYNALHEAVGGIRLENNLDQIDEAQRGMSTMSQYFINPTQLRTAQPSFGGAAGYNFGNTFRSVFG